MGKTGNIPYDKLEEMSKLYDVSSMLFLNNQKPPIIKEEVTDYRTDSSKSDNKTPEILKEIKQSKNKREIVIDLKKELNEDVSFKFNIENKTEKECLKTLSTSLEVTNSKRQCYAFKDWLRKFESMNILIFQFYNIPTSEVSGYAFNYDKLPIIGINHSFSDNEKIFLLFHEYAHLLLGESGISGDFNSAAEQNCSKIAREALLPEKELNILLQNISDYPLNLKVDIISKKFKLNNKTIINRLLDLKTITKDQSEEY